MAAVIKALIFDFDGLILDTETADYQSWMEVFEQYAVPLPFSIWATGVGTSLEVFNPLNYLETLVGPLDRITVKAAQKKRMTEIIDDLPLLPGVETGLEQAASLGLRCAIASTASRRWIDHHLDRLGLMKWFDFISTGDQVARVKPFPDVYMAALAGLSIGSADAVAFEDSPNGIQAAKAAELRCVAIPNPITRLLDISQADIILDSLAEFPLVDLIRRIENLPNY